MLYKDKYFEIIPKPKSEEDENSLKNQMVAMSKSFAKTQNNWNLEQKKLFFMCLSKIAWGKEGNSNEVTLSKREIIEALGLNIDASDQSTYLRKAFQELARNSEVHWTDPDDKSIWEDDFLITKRKSTRGSIVVTFNPYFMPHLENLAKSYITFLTDDIYGFKCKFSIMLFQELRLHCDTRKTNWRTYSTKQLKEIFGLSKTDYVSNGKFDRYNFEKKVLDKAIDEINETQMMKILPFIGLTQTKNGYKMYEKIKKGNSIIGYRLKYDVRVKRTDQRPKDEFVFPIT